MMHKLAAELGADAVGFVFAPSPRQVTAADVAHITPHLPEGIECVGVFPALDAQQIASIAQECGLTAVQLHGGVNLELLRQLDEIFNGQVKLIQTVHWQVDGDGANAAVVAEQLRQIDADGLAARVLIDTKVGSSNLGGTGIPFDWDAARATLAEAGAGLKVDRCRRPARGQRRRRNPQAQSLGRGCGQRRGTITRPQKPRKASRFHPRCTKP